MAETPENSSMMPLEGASKDVDPSKVSQKAKDLAAQLVPEKGADVDNYGLQLQGYMKNLSLGEMNKTRVNNAGEIGNELAELATTLEMDKDEQPKGMLSRLFHRAKKAGIMNYTRYQTTDKAVGMIKGKLVKSQNQLKDTAQTLALMREDNVNYCKTLTDYIDAGQIRLNEMDNKTIPELQDKLAAEKEGTNGWLTANQKLQDAIDFKDQLSKRVYDLRLAQQISIQTEPQLRIMLLDTKQLIGKVRESIDISIPLWQRSIQSHLILQDIKQANAGVKAMQDKTNKMLMTNSDMLKEQSAETFDLANRGIVDEDTLQHAYDSIVDTVKACRQYQEEGEKRRDASHLDEMRRNFNKQMNEVNGEFLPNRPAPKQLTDDNNDSGSAFGSNSGYDNDTNGGESNGHSEHERFDPNKF